LAENPFKERVPAYVNKRRRQQRSAETRERILKIAYAEFAEMGFEGTSTRVIASKAGVHHPLVTYHFKSKEGLWKEVMNAVAGDFTERWQARMAGLEDTDDVTQLRLIQEDFIRFAAANPDFHWLMANEGDRLTERLRWIVQTRSVTYFSNITRLIKSAQRAGRYVEGDPHHLQYLFIGAVTRIFMQAAEAEAVMGQSPFSPSFVERHVATCCALFFRGPRSKMRTARKSPKLSGDSSPSLPARSGDTKSAPMENRRPRAAPAKPRKR
jgi:TetR/AcrR family transcriptional regulator